MTSRFYRLPNGATTTDPDLYSSAWHEIAEPIERRLGWTFIAFDPDVSFRVSGTEHWRMATTIPTEIAMLIFDLERSNNATADH